MPVSSAMVTLHFEVGDNILVQRGHPFTISWCSVFVDAVKPNKLIGGSREKGQVHSANTIHNGISTRARNYERSESQPQTLGRHDSSRETERGRVDSWQLAGEATRQEEEFAEEVTRHELPVPALQVRDIEIDPKAETYQEISVQGSSYNNIYERI